MQNRLCTVRTFMPIKTFHLITSLSLLSILLVSCQVFPITSGEPHPLPRTSVVVRGRDRVWIIDSDTDVVTHGPFCLSGFWTRAFIGDAEIASNNYLYISIEAKSDPDKRAGEVVVVLDPVRSQQIGEIVVPIGPKEIVEAGNNLLYVSSQTNKVAVIDRQANTVIDEIVLDLRCTPEKMVLGANDMLYVSSCKTLVAIDTTTNSLSGSPMEYATHIYDIAVGSGGYLYMLLFNAIHVIDPTDWETVASISNNLDLSQCNGLYLAITGQGKVYVTCHDKSAVMAYEASSGMVTLIPLPYGCSRIVASDNGKMYLLEQDEGKVLVLDTESDVIVTEIVLP